MKYRIGPSKAKGVVTAPPSKSMAHRLLICAALSKQTSIIQNIEYSEDILATIDCLKALGADIKVGAEKVEIKGIIDCKSDICLKVRESGSTLRFLIPIALLTGQKLTFIGSERLMQRPLYVYKRICTEQGIDFNIKNNELSLQGKLKAGVFNIEGNISSQFITGLLFALPLLEKDSQINILPPFESKPYVLMTIDAMKKFGVNVELKDNSIYIKGNQEYIGCNQRVEGDWSNAAFLDAFNFIGGSVRVNGLNEDSLQGDKQYKEIFEKLKAENAQIDLSDCPDLGPIAMALAYKNGATFNGTARLKLKESDRCRAMADELMKFGIRSSVQDNTMTVYKGEIRKPALAIESHNDHRIAMSMTVLLTVCGGEINGAQAVSKSFPSFFEEIKKLGIEVIKYGSDL